MVRYRVGNKYLSEKEYRDNWMFKWKMLLFVLGAVAAGIMMNKWLVGLEVIKEIRFAIVIVSGVLSRYLSARFSKVIIYIIVAFFGVAILSNVLRSIWQAI